MADNKEKQATCPVCGYTDTALDSDVLEEEMRQHMRTAHNQVLPVDRDNSDLKKTGRTKDDSGRDTSTTVPGVPSPVAAGDLAAPGNNIGNNRTL